MTPDATSSLAGVRVLIVEDDVDSRDFLELYLAREGCHVDVAGTAREARDVIRARAPDVILADLSLPEEDGCSFVRSLRFERDTPVIPVIALTGYSDAESRAAAKAAGFQKIIVKPIDVFALPAEIEGVLAAGRA